MPPVKGRRFFTSFEIIHKIQAVRCVVVDISRIDKTRFFVNMKCRRVLFIYANLNTFIFSFSRKKLQNKVKGFRPVPPVLEAPVNHKFLQIVTSRLFVKVPNERGADNIIIIGKDYNPGITVAVNVSPCENTDCRGNEIFLLLVY